MKVGIISCSSRLGDCILRNAIKIVGKENIVGICRTPSKMDAKKYGIEIRKGDFYDKKLLETSFKGLDKVMLISSNSHPQKRYEEHSNVITAAKAANVKHFVYTSIMGVDNKVSQTTTFGDIVKSNEKTEQMIKDSGMIFTIGRNSLYLDADLESIEMYKKDGCIINCAGTGKVGVISREEMGFAYATILKGDKKHHNKVYNIGGEPITQQELTEEINKALGLKLGKHKNLSVKEYEEDRIKAFGNEFFGKVISGIYDLIAKNGFEVKSDFEIVTGRKLKPLVEYIKK